MIIKTPGPWTYRAYPSDTKGGDFGPLAPFVEIWRRKCPGPGKFPAWNDFDLMDFDGWWGQVSLAEIHSDPFDIKWVLWGTLITDWWGTDYTGKMISDIPAVKDVWENYERDYLLRLLREHLIGYVSGTLAPQGRKNYYIYGVDLPLEKNGEITHVMSAYQLCEPEDAFLPPEAPIFKM